MTDRVLGIDQERSTARTTDLRTSRVPPSDFLKFIGWYDSAEQDEPTHAPVFPGPCIVCMKPMTAEDVRTVNLMWQERTHDRSVFYRTHRTCAESLSAAEHASYDGAVLDAMPHLVTS